MKDLKMLLMDKFLKGTIPMFPQPINDNSAAPASAFPHTKRVGAPDGAGGGVRMNAVPRSSQRIPSDGDVGGAAVHASQDAKPPCSTIAPGSLVSLQEALRRLFRRAKIKIQGKRRHYKGQGGGRIRA